MVKSKEAYRQHKSRASARERAISLAGRDIGAISPVVDVARKQKSLTSLLAFCEYFPKRFFLPWSPDHLKVILKLERAIRYGGLFALAMPRGSGKTTLCTVAALWAVLAGHRAFVMVIGNSDDAALDLLHSMKVGLSRNDLLLEDYPEVCYPIRCLQNEARRCLGQLHHGEPTFMEWGTKQIVLPTIPGSRAAGGTIRTAGITGNVRGAFRTTPEGMVIRPELVILDDPQTDQSAKSIPLCQTRVETIQQAVLNLAGPTKKISAVMPCTKIRVGDLSDTFLDRKRNPEWQGERTKLLNSFPSNMKLWEQYDQIRNESLAADGTGKEATEFYAAHRKQMDAGAEVAWLERYKPDEISAVQHAMNLFFRDESAFFAEYQNDPRIADEDVGVLTPEEVLERYNGRKRKSVPTTCTKLTMFVDVHDNILFYVICAWEPKFTGYVIEYGTLPEQGRGMFTQRSVTRTLQTEYPGLPVEEQIAKGLDELLRAKLKAAWRRDDGAAMRIARCLVDRGYKKDIVEAVCLRIGSPALMPSWGVPITASSKPFSEYRREAGQEIGHYWRIPSVRKIQEARYVQVDVNYWKSFVHNRFRVEPSAPASMTIYGTNRTNHRLFAEHVVAERPIRTEGRGRVVYEWKQVPSRDNHWLDCLVGCAAAAAMEGISLDGAVAGMRTRGRKRVRIADRKRIR